MAEPKKASSWLAAAKAVPTSSPAGPSSPEQLSRLVALCNSSKSKTSVGQDGFITIRQKRKSNSLNTGEISAAEADLPPGEEDFPALESPPKSGILVKKGKELRVQLSDKKRSGESKAQSVGAGEEEEKRSLLLPEVTAEFDGLMSELLTGLRLQGPQVPLSDSPQTGGPVESAPEPVLVTQVQKLNGRAVAQRVLFPENAPQILSALAPSSKATKPVQGVPLPPIPLSHEVSFFAVPPKTPNVGAAKPPKPYSPKSVLDLSSPVGSPAANQTPPAGGKRSPYRPAMTADPKKVIGRKAELQSSPANVVTSSPFSYSLWGPAGPPLMSPPLQAEAHILRESPSNLVKESRLATWLGKGLLVNEGFQRTGAFVRPTPFGRTEMTSADEDEALCKICFEKESNSAYLCGHVLCGDCAEYIYVNRKICPFCAKPIKSVVKMFV